MPDDSGSDGNIFNLEIEVGKEVIRWRKNIVPTLGEEATVDNDSDDHELVVENYESFNLLVDLLELLTCLYRDRERRSTSTFVPNDAVSNEMLRKYSNRLIRYIGAQLYRVLFKEKLYIVLTSLLNDKHVKLLRIRLEFRDEVTKGSFPKIQSWPWEFLRVPDDEKYSFKGEFLALRAHLSLMRHLKLGEAVSMRIDDSAKILFVVSNPEPLPPVDGEFVCQEIEKVFGKHAVVPMIHKRRPKEEPDPNWKPIVTYESFRKAVEEEKPNIIHLIAHGARTVKGGQIAFSDVSGSCEWIFGEQLANDLAKIENKEKLKLVFLQVCESALPDPFVGISSVAQCLASKNIPAVIGMQAKIEQEMAGKFAQKFYEILANHGPVDVAVQQGRAAIKYQDLKSDYTFALPVIYLQSYASLLARKAQVARNDTSQPTPQPSPLPSPQPTLKPPLLPSRQCPNCGSLDMTMTCRKCGLSLACLTCNPPIPIRDPLKDNFCDYGHRIKRDEKEIEKYTLEKKRLEKMGRLPLSAALMPDEFVPSE